MMKYFKINLKVAFIVSALFSTFNITTGLSASAEAVGFGAVIETQNLVVGHLREIGKEVFGGLSVSDTLSAANKVVGDFSGLSYSNRLIRSIIEVKVASVQPLRLTETINRQDETPVRIFFELCFHAGVHNAEITSGEEFQEIHQKTMKFMEALGDVRGHRVRVTIRGGVSEDEDKAQAKLIIKAYLKSKYVQGVSEQKLELESIAIANTLIENKSTYLGFAMLGRNIAARKMYIATCLRVLMEKLNELTESTCVVLARTAIQAHQN
jgi:hypothetical protein